MVITQSKVFFVAHFFVMKPILNTPSAHCDHDPHLDREDVEVKRRCVKGLQQVWIQEGCAGPSCNPGSSKGKFAGKLWFLYVFVLRFRALSTNSRMFFSRDKLQPVFVLFFFRTSFLAFPYSCLKIPHFNPPSRFLPYNPTSHYASTVHVPV